MPWADLTDTSPKKEACLSALFQSDQAMVEWPHGLGYSVMAEGALVRWVTIAHREQSGVGTGTGQGTMSPKDTAQGTCQPGVAFHMATLTGPEASWSTCLRNCSHGHTKVCLTNHLDVSQSRQDGTLDVASQEFRYLFSCLLACSQIHGWTFCCELKSTVPLILSLEEYYGCYYDKINKNKYTYF